MIIRAARHIKELRRTLTAEQASSADSILGDPFELLKQKPPRAEIAADHDSGDGKAAAQRYAAQYAQREAQAQSDGDRISQLSAEMQEMKKVQSTRSSSLMHAHACTHAWTHACMHAYIDTYIGAARDHQTSEC